MSYRYGLDEFGGEVGGLLSLCDEEFDDDDAVGAGGLDDDDDAAGGLDGDGLRPPLLPNGPCDDEAGDGLVDGRAFGCSSGMGILLRWTITV